MHRPRWVLPLPYLRGNAPRSLSVLVGAGATLDERFARARRQDGFIVPQGYLSADELGSDDEDYLRTRRQAGEAGRGADD